MSLQPIILGIARPEKSKPGDVSKNKGGAEKSASDPSGRDKKLSPALEQKIFERDGYACRYCGFCSRKYQKIHFLNHIHTDHAEDNLATACIFCHQCFNLENVNEMRSGVLLWLPEIGQAELHHMARALYVARISQGPIAEAARKALDALMARREAAKQRLGTDNPYILATVLSDYLGSKHYAVRQKKLDGVRLFPLDRRIIKEADLEFNQFPQILAYWRSKDGPFGGKAPTQWVALYKDLAKAA